MRRQVVEEGILDFAARKVIVLLGLSCRVRNFLGAALQAILIKGHLDLSYRKTRVKMNILFLNVSFGLDWTLTNNCIKSPLKTTHGWTRPSIRSRRRTKCSVAERDKPKTDFSIPQASPQYSWCRTSVFIKINCRTKKVRFAESWFV